MSMSVDGVISQDDPRVIRALEEYLTALEAGQRPQRDQFLARHAEIADVLVKCLDGLDLVQAAAPDVGQASSLSKPAGWDESASPTNQSLGDYRILRELGRGGMGVVYEAQQLSLNRRVALKVLPFAAVMDPRALQRFKNEAQAAAALDHAHIVDVYGIGCERGVHFYAMRLIEGQTLAEVIEHLRASDRSPLPAAGEGPGVRGSARETVAKVHDPTAQSPLRTPHSALPTGKDFHRFVAQLGIDAAEALDHAHQQGVIHRDIKPSNLMLDARGQVWITDFGLARIGNDAQLTSTGDLLGTLRYMSPEQALGEHLVLDHRTDVYSLGATLYELLTQEPVLAGCERAELVREIADADPRPLRHIDGRIPADLETIVLKCLEKDAADRYATSRDLSDDLRRFLAHQTVLASRLTLAQRTNKWIRRHARTVQWALACLMLASAGLAVSTALVVRADGKTKQALERANLDRQRAETKSAEALRSKEESLKSKEATRQQLYVSNMNLAYQAWHNGDLSAVQALLTQHVPGAGETDLRGWEWHYLQSLLSVPHPTPSFHTPAHGGGVYCIRQSPAKVDEEIGIPWLTAGADGLVKLWKLGRQAEELAVCRGHGSEVDMALFTPDGKTVVSCSDDSTIRLWEATTGKPLDVLRGHRGEVTCIDISPDGKLLASGGRDSIVRVWDLEKREVVKQLEGHQGIVHAVAFHRLGGLLASAADDQAVYTWSVDHGKRMHTLKDAYPPLAFSHITDCLATAGGQGTIKLWDGKFGDLQRVIGRHVDTIQTLSFAREQDLLSSCSDDGAARLWDAHTGAMLQHLVATQGRTWSVAIAHDNRLMVTGGSDGMLRAWKTFTQPGLKWGGDFNVPTQGLAFLPRSHSLVALVGDNHAIGDWNLADTGTPGAKYDVRAPCRAIAFAPQTDEVFTAVEDGTVFKRSLRQANPHQILASPTPYVPAGLAVAANSSWVAAWGTTGSLRIWDVPGQRVWNWPMEDCVAAAFLKQESLIAASGSGTIRVWDLKAQDWSGRFAPLQQQIAAVALSADGATLAVATRSPDMAIKLHDTATGTLARELKGHLLPPQSLAWSADSKTLASASPEGQVRLWRAATGQQLGTLKCRTAGDMPHLAFSPDGQALAAAVHGNPKSQWNINGVCMWHLATAEVTWNSY